MEGGREESTTYLQHIQKFKCLHFKTEGTVDHEQHQVRRFGQVKHCAEVVGRAFEEGDALALPRHDGDGAWGRER